MFPLVDLVRLERLVQLTCVQMPNARRLGLTIATTPAHAADDLLVDPLSMVLLGIGCASFSESVHVKPVFPIVDPIVIVCKLHCGLVQRLLAVFHHTPHRRKYRVRGQVHEFLHATISNLRLLLCLPILNDAHLENRKVRTEAALRMGPFNTVHVLQTPLLRGRIPRLRFAPGQNLALQNVELRSSGTSTLVGPGSIGGRLCSWCLPLAC
mmetsp:Transcript_92348/g.282710  ORF Transcript_92348/g.282710 Transcript_92348/m.282710 type:complete len:210 (-) Transcript_92348:47-676(-)